MPSRSESVRAALALLPDSAWTPYEVTEDYVRSFAMLDLGGQQVRAERCQYLADDLLQKANAHEYAESEGKRWGDGRVVARLPLNKWFSELRDHVRDGDKDHLNWWLNKPENKPFRTFRGKV
jgi:hypothetical protein